MSEHITIDWKFVLSSGAAVSLVILALKVDSATAGGILRRCSDDLPVSWPAAS